MQQKQNTQKNLINKYYHEKNNEKRKHIHIQIRNKKIEIIWFYFSKIKVISLTNFVRFCEKKKNDEEWKMIRKREEGI